MKKESNLTLGISEPEKVGEYLKNLNHPLMEMVQLLRKIILSTDEKIGEGIYWNAPTFYYTGEMKAFEPKEYKRYLVGFVFNKPEVIRMVFLKGANVTDSTGILEGSYKDGRRLAVFNSVDDIKNKEQALREIIKELVKQMN
jgi:hypothetical protein